LRSHACRIWKRTEGWLFHVLIVYMPCHPPSGLGLGQTSALPVQGGCLRGDSSIVIHFEFRASNISSSFEFCILVRQPTSRLLARSALARQLHALKECQKYWPALTSTSLFAFPVFRRMGTSYICAGVHTAAQIGTELHHRVSDII
jgi:hypothetical protein